MLDAAGLLASSARQLNPNFPAPLRYFKSEREREIRADVSAKSRAITKCARRWTGENGDGEEAQYLPVVLLADLVWELHYHLILSQPRLVPDKDRERRRWDEIEAIVAEADQLVTQVTVQFSDVTRELESSVSVSA